MAGEIDLAGQGSDRAIRPSGGGVVAARVAWALTTALFVVALPTALILGAVRFAFSWQPVYTYAIKTYHADEFTGISTPELLRATHVIRNYFTNDQQELDIAVQDAVGQTVPLFNDREISHMRDVKVLVGRVYFLLAVATLYVVGYAMVTVLGRQQGWQRLAHAVIGGALLTIGILIAFGAAALLGFERLFVAFHELSFSNALWQLDPAHDHLIQMFQEGFWFDVAMFVAFIALLASLGLLALAGTYVLLNARAAARQLITPANVTRRSLT